MEFSPWISAPKPDPQLVARLMEDADLTELVASLLVQRGITTRKAAKEFLHPHYSSLHNPTEMRDMEKAGRRLLQAISNNEGILVYGDYDVDGITSVAMVASYLEGIGATVGTYLPHRYEEGYGVSVDGVQHAIDNGYDLMITLDCGMKDFEPLRQAQNAGVDVIVCDHHLPEADLPPAWAILNPKRPDCDYPFKELSGCGVAFKLLQHLADQMDFPPGRIFEELDLVAISIGADLVDVLGENRFLAAEGLKQLRKMQRPGLKALMRAANLPNPPKSIRDISFTLGPRINAAGRMAHAQRAVDLLMEKSESSAAECAKDLEEMNRQRRDVDEQTTQQAIEKLDRYSTTMYCNVVWGKDWHRGVVGIVASRLVEHRYRPTIVLSEESGMLLGSARSVHGVDIHQALEACSDLLDQFGGHPMAAGLSLSKNNLLAFEARLEASLRKQLDEQEPRPVTHYDMETTLDRLTGEAHIQLQQLEPHGPGNPTPVFMVRNVVSTKPPRAVGGKKQHLKLSLASPERPDIVIETVGFNLGHQLPEVRRWRMFDVTFTLTLNTWRDRGWQPRTELNLHLRAIRESDQAQSFRSEGTEGWEGTPETTRNGSVG